MTLGLCNIMAKLPSEGLCSWSPDNHSVAPKEGWVPCFWNPTLDRATMCRCCLWINSGYTLKSFRSMKSLTVT